MASIGSQKFLHSVPRPLPKRVSLFRPAWLHCNRLYHITA